ncbi:MAG: pyrimidine/purine nucleoside phosphorylase [Pseudodesulfovibrio sp.]
MSEFAGVTVRKEANIYFDGKVTSRVVTFPDGSVKTLGIMLPGDYEFGTDKPEIMEILSGEMQVLLPGCDQWTAVTGGQSFDVPGRSRFKLQVRTIADYCCSYVG